MKKNPHINPHFSLPHSYNAGSEGVRNTTKGKKKKKKKKREREREREREICATILLPK